MLFFLNKIKSQNFIFKIVNLKVNNWTGAWSPWLQTSEHGRSEFLEVLVRIWFGVPFLTKWFLFPQFRLFMLQKHKNRPKKGLEPCPFQTDFSSFSALYMTVFSSLWSWGTLFPGGSIIPLLLHLIRLQTRTRLVSHESVFGSSGSWINLDFPAFPVTCCFCSAV